MQVAFWIVVYSLHADRCHVSQDIPGVSLRYETEQACKADIPDGKQANASR